MTRVCLAVLTTGSRRATLDSCLRAVDAMEIPTSFTLDVVIVRNGIAHPDDEAPPCELPSSARIGFILERRRGIPFARNAALDHALAHQYDYLGFVDDDARPEPNWLANAVSMLKQSGAHGVTGPQAPDFPERTPTPLRSAEIYRERRLRHGQQCRWAATNNVIFSLSHTRAHDLRFNETFLAGGSDKEFFLRFTHAGGVLRWAGDAVVREHVGAERLSVRWAMQRAYRLGATEFRIERAVRAAPAAALLCWAKGCAHVAYGLIILPTALLPQSPGLIDAVTRFWRGAGLVLGVFSVFRNRSYT